MVLAWLFWEWSTKTFPSRIALFIDVTTRSGSSAASALASSVETSLACAEDTPVRPA